MSKYIYLVREREFIKMEERIYRIGITNKPNLERFNQFPLGSALIFQMVSMECNLLEKEMIQLFKTKYIQRRDIGNSYFEGNCMEMMCDISDGIKRINEKNIFNDDNDFIVKKKRKNKKNKKVVEDVIVENDNTN